jgi:hypothetical protein
LGKKAPNLSEKRGVFFGLFLTDIAQFLNRLIKCRMADFPIFDKKIT